MVGYWTSKPQAHRHWDRLALHVPIPTERDRRILEAVYAYDGILGFSQVQRMFFTDKSQAELRLKLLYQHGYLNRLNLDQCRHLPEMIYWLDKKGAELVASLEGVPMSEFTWREEPLIQARQGSRSEDAVVVAGIASCPGSWHLNAMPLSASPNSIGLSMYPQVI